MAWVIEIFDSNFWNENIRRAWCKGSATLTILKDGDGCLKGSDFMAEKRLTAGAWVKQLFTE
jgi:hypothetical protein